MKKPYKVASALNIKTETIKNFINNNKVNFELRGGVYYVDENEVSEAHRLNRFYFVDVSLGSFELEFNDTYSKRIQYADFDWMKVFVKEWNERINENYRDSEDVKITEFSGNTFGKVTLYIDAGDCNFDEILDYLRYMHISKYRLVDEDDLSPDEYQYAYGDGSWKYVGLYCQLGIKDYGLVQNQKMAA